MASPDLNLGPLPPFGGATNNNVASPVSSSPTPQPLDPYGIVTLVTPKQAAPSQTNPNTGKPLSDDANALVGTKPISISDPPQPTTKFGTVDNPLGANVNPKNNDPLKVSVEPTGIDTLNPGALVTVTASGDDGSVYLKASPTNQSLGAGLVPLRIGGAEDFGPVIVDGSVGLNGPGNTDLSFTVTDPSKQNSGSVTYTPDTGATSLATKLKIGDDINLNFDVSTGPNETSGKIGISSDAGPTPKAPDQFTVINNVTPPPAWEFNTTTPQAPNYTGSSPDVKIDSGTSATPPVLAPNAKPSTTDLGPLPKFDPSTPIKVVSPTGEVSFTTIDPNSSLLAPDGSINPVALAVIANPAAISATAANIGAPGNSSTNALPSNVGQSSPINVAMEDCEGNLGVENNTAFFSICQAKNFQAENSNRLDAGGTGCAAASGALLAVPGAEPFGVGLGLGCGAGYTFNKFQNNEMKRHIDNCERQKGSFFIIKFDSKQIWEPQTFTYACKSKAGGD